METSIMFLTNISNKMRTRTSKLKISELHFGGPIIKTKNTGIQNELIVVSH